MPQSTPSSLRLRGRGFRTPHQVPGLAEARQKTFARTVGAGPFCATCAKMWLIFQDKAQLVSGSFILGDLFTENWAAGEPEPPLAVAPRSRRRA